MGRDDGGPGREDCTPQQWADFSELCRYLRSLNLPQRLADKQRLDEMRAAEGRMPEV